jgi:hypothetical protein
MRRNLTYAGGRLVVAWRTEPRHEKIFRDIFNARNPKEGTTMGSSRRERQIVLYYLGNALRAGLDEPVFQRRILTP